MWVAHQDGCLDRSQSFAGKSTTRTTTESIVHDLATLNTISDARKASNAFVFYLRVANKHNLSVRTLSVVARYGLNNSSGSLLSGLIIADTTTGRLSTASWIVDSLRASAWICGFNLVNEIASSAVTWGRRGFACAEGVDLGAALPLFKVQRVGSGEAS